MNKRPNQISSAEFELLQSKILKRLKIEQVRMDENSRLILRKLHALGFSVRNVVYTISESEISAVEFQRLMQRGRVQLGGVHHSVLKSFVQIGFAGNVSKIGFVLNFDLV